MSYRVPKRRLQRGQAIVEYAVIAGTLIIAIASAMAALQPLLGASVTSTMEGFSSPSLR